MIPQYFEFQTTIQKFIEEAIPQLTDVNRAWISLYIHLSACDEQQTLVTITSFYSQMHKHAKRVHNLCETYKISNISNLILEKLILINL